MLRSSLTHADDTTTPGRGDISRRCRRMQRWAHGHEHDDQRRSARRSEAMIAARALRRRAARRLSARRQRASTSTRRRASAARRWRPRQGRALRHRCSSARGSRTTSRAAAKSVRGAHVIARLEARRPASNRGPLDRQTRSLVGLAWTARARPVLLFPPSFDDSLRAAAYVARAGTPRYTKPDDPALAAYLPERDSRDDLDQTLRDRARHLRDSRHERVVIEHRA